MIEDNREYSEGRIVIVKPCSLDKAHYREKNIYMKDSYRFLYEFDKKIIINMYIDNGIEFREITFCKKDRNYLL